MGAQIEVTSENFDGEVLQSDLPVVVDFWAEWCIPCKMVTPILEKIAEENKDKLKFVTINVDQAPDLAEKYNVVSIPTILFLKNGEIVDQKIGAGPKKVMEEFISKALTS